MSPATRGALLCDLRHGTDSTTLDYLKADPTIGRAEALRRAMLACLNDASNPRNAYPAYWAPFELVGEAR